MTAPQAVQALQLPAGEGYAWAAGEAAVMAANRQVLAATHGLDKDHIRAAYWKRGAQAHHENLWACTDTHCAQDPGLLCLRGLLPRAVGVMDGERTPLQ